MPSLQDLNLKNVYRTGKDDLYNDFYKKSLSLAISYDRAVGYFSSEILSMSLKGLSELILSNGKMRLIIGHPLSNDEFEAVKHGFILKEITSNLSEKLEEMLTSQNTSNPRLELLSLLIAAGNLEIKFALRRAGMYHEKIGVFRDSENNIVVFQGSANETPHGMVSSLNAESISVYKSWEEEIFKVYGQEFIDGFEKLWLNDETEVITIDVPSSTYEKISACAKKESVNYSYSSIKEFEEQLEVREGCSFKLEPFIPKKIGNRVFNIYEHQRDALASWKGNAFKGILKLATGSGKTITSIYGAVKIFEAKKKKQQQLFLIIAVPYVELAIQWIENLRIFGIDAHECFDSKKSWAESLKNQVSYFNAGVSDFCAAVVVNRTLASPLFQSLITSIDSNSLMIIGDECHNHGSKNLNAVLPDAYYRMGLSATPFRSDNDEIDSPFPNDAKERLLSYYGDIVATYGLDDAINDGILTPYEYHIVPVYLSIEEQEKYEELSLKITKLILKGSSLTQQDRESLTMFCGQRSRLLGAAQNKLVELNELTAQVTDEEKSHTLFYAGEGKPYGESDDGDMKVIDKVSKVLNKNGWKTSQFTGDVTRNERKFLMSAFKDKTIDALVAMKVLDEGIDVPACKTAYILASTKNPRQYVQRRGRILRKSENKHLSTIYDFVVLPINDSPASQKLKLSEAERINDFTLLATNKADIEQLIDEHGLTYDFNR